MAIIEAHNIVKRYPPRRGARALLGRGGISEWFRPSRQAPFEALRGVTLTVERGESLGIIGRNGSGKSTLLKILAGVTLPTEGSVQVRGRIASLLELGAGFHPMLTGRENVYLNAGLLGMGKRDVDKVFDSIVDFSGIAEFIDQPVDTYSSGMYVRIAFSVAVHANPDVFLVDEVLAVGDEAFQRKCRAKIGELRSQGKTIVFVSHDLGLVHALCDRVVLLNKGAMVVRKTAQATIEYYLRLAGEASGIHTIKTDTAEAVFSHGKVALFQNQEERTAPNGINCQILSMGQHHDAGHAAWEVVEAGDDRCTAVGDFSRIPAKIHWELAIEGRILRQTLSLEVVRPFSLEHVALYATFPARFTRFLFGTREEDFPAIAPTQRNTEVIIPLEPGVEAGALEDPDRPAHNLHFRAESAQSGGYSYLNSEFMSSSRIVQVVARFPQSRMPLEPGTYPLLAFGLHFPESEDAYRQWKEALFARETVRTGRLEARFQRGAIQLQSEGRPLTGSLGCHVQCRVAGMWTLSPYFDWTAPEAHGDLVSAVGTSTRVPFSLHCTLAAQEDCLLFRAWLACDEAVMVEEYNFTAVLPPAFGTWRSDHESARFPEIPADQHQWHHVNGHFGEAAFAEADDDAGQRLRIETADDCPPLHFSALTTGVAQNGHVLQLMRSGGREGALHFAEGEHLILSLHLDLETVS